MKAKIAAVMVVMIVLALAFAFVRMKHTDAGTVKVQPDAEVKTTTEAPTTEAPSSSVAGITELKFSEFFASPIGGRGLTLTDKLRGLDGKRVQILGYMAQQEQPVPGMFLFSALPVRLNEEHYGLADDLPAATLFVSMPKNRDQVVPHTPGLMLLTGTLGVGNREEADGRISTVRLALEIPESTAKKNFHSSPKGAEQSVRRGK